MSKKRIYTMRKGDDKWYFDLHVYPTLKAMHRGMGHMDKGIGGISFDSKTLGLVHPVGKQSLVDGVWIEDGLYCQLFLNEEHLTNEIVTHECVHVALSYERYCNGKEIPSYGAEISEDEERLAYLIGELTAGVFETLAENGHKVSPR
jgi:hypothetical protein